MALNRSGTSNIPVINIDTRQFGMHERYPSLPSLPLPLGGAYQLFHHVVLLSVFPVKVSNSPTLPPNHITNQNALSVVMDIMHDEQ